VDANERLQVTNGGVAEIGVDRGYGGGRRGSRKITSGSSHARMTARAERDIKRGACCARSAHTAPSRAQRPPLSYAATLIVARSFTLPGYASAIAHQMDFNLLYSRLVNVVTKCIEIISESLNLQKPA